MSTTFDPLAVGPGSDDRVLPDRVFYAPGVLLDAPDLAAEQLYHRGRLARSLFYLHGSGTVTGLRVLFQPALNPGERDPEDRDETDPTGPGRLYPDGREARLLVEPGLAIDRLGRLIELPTAACLRLQRWLTKQADSDINQATHPQVADTEHPITRADVPDPIIVNNDNRGIVADVFIRFTLCEAGGRTPAFAASPFDVTNANVPARLRDSSELTIVLRSESTNDLATELPFNPWADAGDLNALRDAVFDNWREGSQYWDAKNRPEPTQEHAEGQDPTSLFLARLLISPDDADTGTPLAVRVDNHSRSFIYPTGAITQWISLITSSPTP